MKTTIHKLATATSVLGILFASVFFPHSPSLRAQPSDADWSFTAIDSVYMQNSPSNHADAMGSVYYTIKGKVNGVAQSLRFGFSANDKPSLGAAAIKSDSPIYKMVENCFRLATLAMVDHQEGGKLQLHFYGQNVSVTSTGLAELDMRNASNGPMFYCTLKAP